LPPGSKSKNGNGDFGDSFKNGGGASLARFARKMHDAFREWNELLHPRGQPTNAGQFVEAGSGVESETEREKISNPVSFGFVSPSVKTGMDFKQAVRELGSAQHVKLTAAIKDINNKLGIHNAHQESIVGTWIDPGGKEGAENSIMMESSADWDHLVLSMAMAMA